MNVFHKYTRKSLLKNKMRTIVTIIGIILSTAMFTAVTTGVSSVQEYMLDVTKATDGSWHTSYANLSPEVNRKIITNDEIKESVTIHDIGYSYLETVENNYKPYLYIGALSENYSELLPFHVIEGKMPENENEIIIPQHLIEMGGYQVVLGDSITLPIGNRISEEGNTLCQKSSYITKEKEEENSPIEALESIQDTREYTYKVVGIYNRANYYIEPYSAPGYSLFTIQKGEIEEGISTTFVTFKHPSERGKFIYDLMDQDERVYIDNDENREYLRYCGLSSNGQ